eukprot:m.335890 g.335890  ORF g.335890 m.335890 type:complete len:101 (+) comp20528_c0_seq2:903-1205(+)
MLLCCTLSGYLANEHEGRSTAAGKEVRGGSCPSKSSSPVTPIVTRFGNKCATTAQLSALHATQLDLHLFCQSWTWSHSYGIHLQRSDTAVSYDWWHLAHS